MDSERAERSPPFDLEAEMSVLGAMLLERECIPEVVEVLGAEDFHLPRHQEVFSAVVAVYDRNDPVDFVTVGDELARRSRLDLVGGREYLVQLSQAVPSAAHAATHARGVRELAIARRLARAAEGIARSVYEERGPIADLLDRAEARIFEISREGSREGAASLRDVIQDTFRHLEVRDRRGRLTGIPTGFYALDELTCGLQGGDFVVLAGRPSMGKTAFALSIAEHVALEEGRGVLFFSLEMARAQIAQRMLCARARVSAQHLRRGTLSPEELERLQDAAGELSEAPIFVDDAASLTPLAVRARARRMKAANDIGVVFVDYLQLLHAPDMDSREQEIALVSRSLKALAREIGAPVVALSQLNRAPERRDDNRPRLADLRECVSGDTLVLLADGRRTPVRDLVGTAPVVWGLDGRDRIVPARVDRVWSVGRRPVYGLRLATGRSVRATADHRFRRLDGWKRLADLRAGDRVAIARVLPEPARSDEWSDDRLLVLGHLVGDGCYLPGEPLRYTTESEENSAALASAARREFGVNVRRCEGIGRWHQMVFSGNGHRDRPSGLNRWLRELGVFGQRSWQKRLPPDVFRLSNRQVAILLRHLWATDGSVRARRVGVGGPPRVYLSTNSRILAGDVAALLLRLGIVARIREVESEGCRPGYTVDVTGSESQRTFLSVVGAFGPRREGAVRLEVALRGVRPNTNVGTIPREVFARVRSTMAERGVSRRWRTRLRGTSYGGTSHSRFAPSRAVLSDYAEVLDAPDLSAIAASDLCWDRVVEIVPGGEEEVFDLTVPGPSCWLADGVVSHNSGAIEQDADVVAFLFREEIYRESDENRGLAELIVAKQRNGPTDSLRLRFFPDFVRFENLAAPVHEPVRG